MLFILNNKQKTVGILSNDTQACPYYSDVHTEAIENNLNIFEFEVPANHPSASLLEVEGYVIYTDLDNKKHLYIIKEINDTHSDSATKKVYCEHSALEMIGNIVRPVTMNSYTLEQAISIALNNTGWRLGDVAFVGLRDIQFTEHITSLEALHQVVDAFDAEMEYEVKFDGSKVTEKLVHVVEKRGQKTGKIFEYSKDLTEVERVEDTRNLVTALIGVGRGDSNGNILKFTDYPAPSDERFVKIDDYVADMEAFQKYNKNGKHIFGVFKDDKATNAVELFNNTKAKLQELSKPKLTFNCKVVTLEKISGLEHNRVRIGDTVVVKDFSYSPALILEARVVELKRSKTDPSNDSVTLGDYKPVAITQNDRIAKLQQVIFEKEQLWNTKSYNVMISSSNGSMFKNGTGNTTLTARIYYGEKEIDNSDAEYSYSWTRMDSVGDVTGSFTGRSIVVDAFDITNLAVYKVEVSKGGSVVGESQYTVVEVYDGEDGIDGQDGVDGETYYTWIKYADDNVGTGFSDNPTGKAYLGIAYNRTSPAESTNPSVYSWSKIQGEQGIEGSTGADGTTYYTWIKYADSADGSVGFSDNGTGKLYLGISYNNLSPTESNNPADYSWTRVKGEQGVRGEAGKDGYTPIKGVDYFDGIDGQDGKNGISSYLWIRYSQNSDGSGMTTDPTNAKYIGTSSTTTTIAPTSNTSYNWTLIKGADGLAGEDGVDGRTSYLHIKYSNDGGATFTSNNGEDVGSYIGTYVDFTSSDSLNTASYTWNKVRGKDGIDGQDGYTPVKGVDYFDGKDGTNGKDGEDGVSSYLWVRYSQYANGNPMTTDPTNAKYVGIATTTNSSAPTAYTSYTWSLIKGVDGVKGETGDNGKTSYLHIKYSDDGGSTFTANNGETVGAWIGTYVDFNSSDSSSVSSYTWNKVKGETGDKGEKGERGEDGYTPIKGVDYFDGKDGTNGTDGKDGTSSYLWVRYSQYSSGSSMTTSPTNANYIGTATTTTPSAPTSYTAYNWTLIKGSDGVKGEDGVDGRSSYLHIKYSDDGGNTFTANTGETVGAYIGTYVDFNPSDSTNVASYTWNRVKGEKGEKGDTGERGLRGLQGETGERGLQGETGADGRSSYTHIAYANNSTGTSGFSTSDSTGKTYVGMYVDFNATDSTNPSSYKWTLIKGSDGSDGIAGKDGADGRTPYLHIAYANNSTGTSGFSTTVSTGKTYIGQYTDFTQADSTNPASYNWTLIKGEKGNKGDKGDTGDKGERGEQGPNIVDSTTEIEANVIKTNHLDVANLSAISANLGTVTAGNITGVNITGGSITSNTNLNVHTNATVGRELYIGSHFTDWTEKAIRFNGNGGMAGLVFTPQYDDIQLYALNSVTLYSPSYVIVDGEMKVKRTASFEDDTSFSGNVYMNYDLKLQNGAEIITPNSEYGWTGVSTMLASSQSGVCAGAWQSFRIKKTYSPSSVNLSSVSANISYAGLATTQINQYGFWIYLSNQSTGFRYWRGTYSA
jgi:phage minor structural protein